MKTVILILLYNKSISESETLLKLYKSSVDTTSVSLIVWNNGPSSISLELEYLNQDRWGSVGLIQTLDNKPLSYIYNQVIELYPAERYVFLDDDSQLTETYLMAMASSNAGVAVPAILSHGEYRSPTVSGKFNPGPYQVTDKVIAIGSGIGVRHDIAQKIKNHYGDVFDSRFALYGVDTTFFLRLHQLGLSDQVEMIDGFEHSLSRLESESQAMSRFRQVERAYDLGLTMRHYTPWEQAIFVIFKQAVKLTLGKLTWLQFVALCKAFKTGRHPKCVSY
ncbi:glycosyltransferase family 2 protein [Aeromonas caviae]|uniref:glycosyltransferase family 2 protein n=1 Tax=Aeromonas caviae TaxID=648 RepID=UPI003754A9F7